MDFSQTLIRASSVGHLMTEPVAKADKEAGLLSKSAQKYLIEVYIAEKYGRKRDVQTKQMRKGNEVEEEAIQMLGNYLQKDLNKNTVRLDNEYIAGTPDVIELHEGGATIYDVKSSYDLWSFLNNLPDKLDSLYYWQMQSYMFLTGADKSYIAYCLLSTPFEIVMQEQKSLLYKMNVVSEESPEYIKEAEKIEFNSTFEDIDPSERILLFSVDRNDDDIEKIKAKVLKARTFLQEIEQTHLNFNK
jgi:hypothetical protein